MTIHLNRLNESWGFGFLFEQSEEFGPVIQITVWRWLISFERGCQDTDCDKHWRKPDATA